MICPGHTRRTGCQMCEHLAVSEPGRPEKKERVKEPQPWSYSVQRLLPSLVSPGPKLLPYHRRRLSKPFPASGLHPGRTVPYVDCTLTFSSPLCSSGILCCLFFPEHTQPCRAVSSEPDGYPLTLLSILPSTHCSPGHPPCTLPTLLLLPVDSFSVPLRNLLR